MLAAAPGRGGSGADGRPLAPLLPGMMLGGGCGQELAHWIIQGRPEKNMYSYDIRRVCPGTRARDYVVRGAR